MKEEWIQLGMNLEAVVMRLVSCSFRSLHFSTGRMLPPSTDWLLGCPRDWLPNWETLKLVFS
jgi:hypothetical protein